MYWWCHDSKTKAMSWNGSKPSNPRAARDTVSAASPTRATMKRRDFAPKARGCSLDSHLGGGGEVGRTAGEAPRRGRVTLIVQLQAFRMFT